MQEKQLLSFLFQAQPTSLQHKKTSTVYTVWFLACFILFVQLSGCTTVGKFYQKSIVSASYYTNRYCFEEPKEKIATIVKQLLLQHHFPIDSKRTKDNHFVTQPVHMPRYSRNIDWAYVISLDIQLSEHKGKIDLGKLPSWAFTAKQPQLPPYPQRKDYKTSKLYHAAQKQYAKRQIKLLQQSAQGYALTKKWEGCNIHTSKHRTVIAIKAIIHAHPIGAFEIIDKKKGCMIASDNSLEHAFLRELAGRLGRRKYIRGMLHNRRWGLQRGNVCLKRKRLRRSMPH